jgi:hypothetical protein
MADRSDTPPRAVARSARAHEQKKRGAKRAKFDEIVDGPGRMLKSKIEIWSWYLKRFTSKITQNSQISFILTTQTPEETMSDARSQRRPF